MRIKISALIAAAVLCACGGGGGGGPVVPASPETPAPSGAPLSEPPVVRAVHGVATVELTAQIDPLSGMPSFVYRGRRGVMPTVRVDPGDQIVVDVANDLPSPGGRGSDLNVHFHGLSVSPNPPADDVLTTLALPGNTLHYVVPIPKSQEPGLYWYHPHVFPVTDLQVGQAGMSGAIVVEGLQRHFPVLATMKERLLIVRDVADSVAQSQAMRPHDEDQNNDPCGPDPGLQTTVNGAVRPTIAIAPGERQFFRVVNATGHKNLKLAVDAARLEVVAIDGFALDLYPGTGPTSTVGSIVVPPAGRVEFVVTGQSGPSELRTLCYDSGPGGDPDPMVVLADLRPPHGGAEPRAHASAALRAASSSNGGAYGFPLPPVAAERTVVFSEDSNGMYVNGKQFSMDAGPMFVVRVGTVERWQIVNITQEVHDFHIHQVHFFVQQVNGVAVPHPHWEDTVVVPARIPGKNGSWKPGYVTLLIDFRDPVIAGEFMFHCHILDHEDAGMMAKIRAI